jgi:hypothetical protein
MRGHEKADASAWLVRGRIENVAKANNPGRQENTGEDGTGEASNRGAVLIEAR